MGIKELKPVPAGEEDTVLERTCTENIDRNWGKAEHEPCGFLGMRIGVEVMEEEI